MYTFIIVALVVSSGSVFAARAGGRGFDRTIPKAIHLIETVAQLKLQEIGKKFSWSLDYKSLSIPDTQIYH